MTVNLERPDISVVSYPPFPQLGDNVDLRCEVTGAGRGYQITWSKVGQSGLDDNALARGDMMRFNKVGRENNGLYRCTVTTRQGTPYADYNLSVSGRPR